MVPKFNQIKKEYPLTPLPLLIEKPKFKLGELKESIPKHCFERSLIKSFGHLLHDIVLISILAYLATFIGHPSLPKWSSYILWPAYWWCQGVVCTGLWVIAHECGHGGFSDYKIVNDTIGLISHSALLVPYFSWKFSHRNHHSNTGSTDNDEVFAPFKKSSFTPMEMIEETPIYTLFKIVLMLTIGWIPGYLFLNSAGPTKYSGQPNSHFNPNSVLFKQ
jgi:omega-6 fatty acid desaturase / acyl-lipid omega-6 desaturase (Delta-12 desaturase)